MRECGKNVPNRHVLVHFCRVIPRRCLERAVVHRDIAAIYRDIDEYIRRGAERHFPDHRRDQRQNDQPRQTDDGEAQEFRHEADYLAQSCGDERHKSDKIRRGICVD